MTHGFITSEIIRWLHSSAPKWVFLGSWLSLPFPTTNMHLISGDLARKKCHSLQRKSARSEFTGKHEISTCFLIHENKFKIMCMTWFFFSYSLLLISCFLTFSQWHWLKNHECQNRNIGLPQWSNGKESAFQCRGTLVQSLVGELRSHMPWGN